MNTQLRLSFLPAFALAGMFIAFAAGCGGGGTNPSTTPSPSGDQHGWGESQLTEGVRLTPDSVVALNLEPQGQIDEGDTGEDGEDRIPYRLDRETRIVAEMNPDDPMYVTLIASATGKLVFEVGPENPKVEMTLPAADYDLYVHSTSGESQAVFVKSVPIEPARDAVVDFNVGILFEVGGCTGCNLRLAKIDGLRSDRALFDRANLYGAIFKNCRLNNASFTGAELTLAGFYDVVSPGANLSGLKLDRVAANNWDVAGANLHNTTFNRANLKGLKLDNANLAQTKLVSSTLATSSLKNTNFEQMLLVQDSKFEGVDLTGSPFPRPIQVGKLALVDCKLPGARLRDFSISPSGITLENCELAGADFTGATFSGISVFTGNDISNTTMPGGTLPTKFVGGKMVGTNFRGLTASGLRFENVDMTNANLANVNLSNTTFDHCVLKGAAMDKFRLNTGGLIWCNLDNALLTGGAQLTNIDMQMSEMSNADLTGARFQAKLLSCRMRSSKLIGADFSGSSYEGTDFAFSDFRQARFVGNSDLGDNDFGNANLSGATWTNGHVCAEGSIGACN